QVMQKVEEELEELKEAVNSENQNEIELEFGDVLFALINYSRFIGVDTESALEKTNLKFIKRFQWMEHYANIHKLNMHELNLEQLDEIWNLAKIALNKKSE
ncbi:MAG TPA: MazG nucleotide pyrophosphohydrolase domain-containing protein, partial [Chitinophagales bacterium]|nr:MazG nucleotide pyrophosphohydrolase domain-containing protein [Chitinophagales bacterium]